GGRERRCADRRGAPAVSSGPQRCPPRPVPAFSVRAVLSGRRRHPASDRVLPRQTRPAPMAAAQLGAISGRETAEAASGARIGIESGSERALDFMAKYGISGVIGGGSAEGGAVERHMVGFQAAYARRGIELELGERLALGYQFHIASNHEQAIREAAPHYEENMKMFGELRLVRALTDEQIAAMRDPRLAGRPE